MERFKHRLNEARSQYGIFMVTGGNAAKIADQMYDWVEEDEGNKNNYITVETISAMPGSKMGIEVLPLSGMKNPESDWKAFAKLMEKNFKVKFVGLAGLT